MEIAQLAGSVGSIVSRMADGADIIELVDSPPTPRRDIESEGM